MPSGACMEKSNVQGFEVRETRGRRKNKANEILTWNFHTRRERGTTSRDNFHSFLYFTNWSSIQIPRERLIFSTTVLSSNTANIWTRVPRVRESIFCSCSISEKNLLQDPSESYRCSRLGHRKWPKPPKARDNSWQPTNTKVVSSRAISTPTTMKGSPIGRELAEIIGP